MTTERDYTASELLAVMSGRLLEDGQVVFAGVGIPLLAATLAQRLHGEAGVGWLGQRHLDAVVDVHLRLELGLGGDFGPNA